MLQAFRLVRVGNVLVSFAGTFVGGLDAWGRGWPTSGLYLVLALAGLSTACVTAGGNVLNDLGDRDSDRRNHPDRPLVTGAVSVARARLLAAGLFVAAVALVLPLFGAAPLVAVVLALALGTLFAYEFELKALGLPGNAAVALLTGLVFIYGAVAVGNVYYVFPFAGMAFLATLSREVIKDMEDAEGDLARRTFPRTHGFFAAAAAARLAVGGAIVLSLVPVIWGSLPFDSLAGSLYLGIVLAADAVFVVSVLWLPRRLHTEQSASKGAMTIALAAFLAVAFR